MLIQKCQTKRHCDSDAITVITKSLFQQKPLNLQGKDLNPDNLFQLLFYIVNVGAITVDQTIDSYF